MKKPKNKIDQQITSDANAKDAAYWEREYRSVYSDLMRERQRSEQMKKIAIELSSRWILQTFKSSFERLAEFERAEDKK